MKLSKRIICVFVCFSAFVFTLHALEGVKPLSNEDSVFIDLKTTVYNFSILDVRLGTDIPIASLPSDYKYYYNTFSINMDVDFWFLGVFGMNLGVDHYITSNNYSYMYIFGGPIFRYPIKVSSFFNIVPFAMIDLGATISRSAYTLTATAPTGEQRIFHEYKIMNSAFGLAAEAGVQFQFVAAGVYPALGVSYKFVKNWLWDSMEQDYRHSLCVFLQIGF